MPSYLDRFQRTYLLTALLPALFILSQPTMQNIAIGIAGALLIAGFLCSNLQRVVFDTDQGVVRYYLFFLFKKEIPLADIEDWEGHTERKVRYKEGKQETNYTHTLTIYTKDGDSYAFTVFARSKMKEFDIKMNNALGVS